MLQGKNDMTFTALKVGFIGLGTMGTPMALNLRKAGHSLFVASRSKIPTAFAEEGATVCTNAAEVAKRADIIITMVPDTSHVEDVLFGETGVVKGLKSGAEGKLVQQELARLAIASVYLSNRESVLEQVEAREILLILHACQTPTDARSLRAALAPGRAAPGGRHAGRSPRFIQENQPPAGKRSLLARPVLAGLRDIGAFLLGGVHRLFFRVSPARFKVLPMVVTPTSMPCSARTHWHN